MLTIVDLDTGNLQSVANAFHRVGAETCVVRTAEAAKDAAGKAADAAKDAAGKAADAMKK